MGVSIIQPAEIPSDILGAISDPVVPHLPLAELALLTVEELALVVEAADAPERLNIVRAVQAFRQETRDERAFEEEVDLQRARKRARREADRRDSDERDAYLTSTEGRQAAAERFAQQIIDLDDLEDPEPLIDGFLHRDTLVRTFGPPKSLKSFVTLDMAACVSLGIPWQGNHTTQTTVLYVVAEGARGVKKRRAAWNEHNGTEMKVIFFPKPVQIGEQQEMYDLIAFCLARDVGYVVFDTQARCTVGVEENDNTEMGQIVAALDILKQETGACVHMVHHSVGSDPKKARGATAWDGAVDAEFYTRRSQQDPELVDLVTKFQKDIEEAEALSMVTVKVGVSLVLALTGQSAETGGKSGEVAPALVSEANAFYVEAVRLFGNQDVSVTDVVNDLKDRGQVKSRSAVKKAFGTLQANGAIEGTGRGTAVRLTQAGLVFSDAWRKRQAQDDSWHLPGDDPDPENP